MALIAQRITVGSTTPVKIAMMDLDNEKNFILVIQNPHSETRHLLLGDSTVNTTNRGYELKGGESLVLNFNFPVKDADCLYAIAESGTGLSFSVLQIGV